MSYTRYFAIFNRWYIAYTLLYIRHSPCTCRIHGIGVISTGDTYPLHFYTSDIHPAHVVYAVLGHIQPWIHSWYTFMHEIFTLHMSYTRYWCISTGDTYPLHFYTSDIHHAHIVSAVLGHIQPLIHILYTFIHQTFTLHMSYMRYWAIFNHWYIAYTLLYIRHSPCTCRIRGIGTYSKRVHIQPLIHSLYTFIHQTYTCTCRIHSIGYWAIYIRPCCTCRYILGKNWYIHIYTSDIPCTCRIHGIGPYSTIDT